jgi:long-chain fatty acid transport protein
LRLGFAASSNFGLAEGYHDAWAGRYYVQQATLAGVSLLPSIAYRVMDKLSLGASLNAMYGVLKDQVAINTATAADGQLKLDDTAWGFGANVGLLYEPVPGTRLGLIYNSRVKLGFNAPARFSGLTPALTSVLQAGGLLNANVDLGITVPQGAMLSAFHEINDRVAVLGSVGWQQWSRFGAVEVGVDSSNPTSLTKDLELKDTWHGALGAQVHLSQAYRLDFGVAYDSAFQDSANLSPTLPANAAWRFGAGLQHDVSKSFSWGAAVEYSYGGTLDIDKQSAVPVALGGRGNLAGSYEDASVVFLSAQVGWKF